MALIKCPACDAQISDLALHCPKCGHPINSAPSTAAPCATPTVAPAASNSANWQTEIPLKSFSNAVRILTMLISILAIIISVIMLVNIYTPDTSDYGFMKQPPADIFKSIKIGLYLLIAVNAIAIAVAISNRKNNALSVAAGMIGSALAGFVILIMKPDFPFGYFFGASREVRIFFETMGIAVTFIGIIIVLYIIIAMCISIIRHRHVARLMTCPTADTTSMQQYCRNRMAMIFLWIFLCIGIFIAWLGFAEDISHYV